VKYNYNVNADLLAVRVTLRRIRLHC